MIESQVEKIPVRNTSIGGLLHQNREKMLLKPWQLNDCFRGSWCCLRTMLTGRTSACNLGPLSLPSSWDYCHLLLLWLQILLKTIPSPTSSAVNIYKIPPLVKDQTSYFQICSSPTLLLREFGRRVKPGETKRIAHCSTLNGKSSQSDFVQSFLPSQIRFCKNKILNQQMSAQAACLSNLALRCELMSVTSFVHLSRIRAIPGNWWSFLWLSLCRKKVGGSLNSRVLSCM